MLEKVIEREKIFFLPGDVVTIKQDIPNKPVMLVKGKEQKLIRRPEDASHLKGIRCQWFTLNGELQEAVFSTKDLEFYKK